MLLGKRLDLVEIDQVVVRPHAILNGVEPFARHGRPGAMSEVAARIEAHSHDSVARLGQRQHDRAVRLRARVGLDVGEAAVEQLLGPLDRQRFHRVRWSAALIVAAARIAFRIFVGEDRALRLQHGAADDIFGRDQLDLGLLAGQLGLDRLGDLWIGIRQPLREKTEGLNVGQIGRGGHQSDS